MHGNRDFLLGQAFVDRFGGELLPEQISIDMHGQQVRLEHGDALCTDDLKYQAFRSMSRDPAWQAGMLSQPLEQRRQIAQMMRMQSQMSGANTPDNIMDVNADAVATVMNGHDVLLHGHTHRPMLHDLSDGKQRLVLGDWREATGEAMIARQQNNQAVALETWHF
jgi:UDP-2,3-diacylglucosamine hydrolase